MSQLNRTTEAETHRLMLVGALATPEVWPDVREVANRAVVAEALWPVVAAIDATSRADGSVDVFAALTWLRDRHLNDHARRLIRMGHQSRMLTPPKASPEDS